MTNPLTRPNLTVTIREHPDKRLSPNAPPPTSLGAKRSRQRVVKRARENGHAAARCAVIDHAVIDDCDLYNAACAAEYPAALRDRGPLDWMAGPVDVDLLIGWGFGRGKHDDDGAIGSAKAYRDGIADLFGASDRGWRYRRVVQTRSARTHPHGTTTFVFTPREADDER